MFESLALKEVEKILDLSYSESNSVNSLDSFVEFLNNIPIKLKTRSMMLPGEYHPIFRDYTILSLNDKKERIDNNPRLPNNTLINSLSFIKEGSFWYAEFSIKKSLEYKGSNTGFKQTNDKHKGLLSCLLITQYLQEKYSSAIETGIRLYDAGHRKLARKLVAQIAVKLDYKINELERDLKYGFHEGLAIPSSSTIDRFIQEKEFLLSERTYAGRSLNHMKGNSYL